MNVKFTILEMAEDAHDVITMEQTSWAVKTKMVPVPQPHHGASTDMLDIPIWQALGFIYGLERNWDA